MTNRKQNIIFCPELIPPILADTKIQTRRCMNEKDAKFLHDFTGTGEPELDTPSELSQKIEGDSVRVWLGEYPDEGSELLRCPYGKVGDKLWVKEAFCTYIPLKKSLNIHTDGSNINVIYKASHKMQDMEGFEDIVLEQDLKWLHAKRMPQWASRITLEITDIRVERLQEISPNDCEYEGITGKSLSSPVRGHSYDEYRNGDGLVYSYPHEAFKALWNSLNKKCQWKDNPYVWVLSFKRVK